MKALVGRAPFGKLHATSIGRDTRQYEDSRQPPSTIAVSKRRFNHFEILDFRNPRSRAVIRPIEKVNDSEDCLEGPRAFAKKRDPVWKGR
jgi:enoyl-CoA hydratase/carnithine racemase